MSEFAPPGFADDHTGGVALGLLGLLMTAAIWYPLKNRGIPNMLAIAGSASALLLQALIPPAQSLPGVPGIAGALAGLVIAGAAFLPLYLTGATTAWLTLPGVP